MQPTYRPIWMIGALALLALTHGSLSAQQAPVHNERAKLLLGEAYLRDNAYSLAEITFNELMRDYPQSKLAPEVMYHLSVAFQLQDRAEEAKKVQILLASKYPRSQWGQLILRSVLDDKELFKIAADAYKTARTSRDAADAGRARDLFLLYAKRFPNDKDKKPEMFFKTALCVQLEDPLEGKKVLEELAKQAKENNWGKMAVVLLGDANTFAEQLDDFAAACRDKEEIALFQELAQRHLPALKPDVAMRCQRYCGLCLAEQGHDEEAVALWTKLLKEQPRSPQAPRVLFTRAEHYYSLKNVEMARADYERLARDYPESEWARIARRWAKWLDHHDEDWAEFEQRFRAIIDALGESNGALAFKLTGKWGDPNHEVYCRVALQDKERFVVEAKVGAKGVLIANDVKYGWYHKLGEPFAMKTEEKLKIGMPDLQFPIDPTTGTVGTKFGWRMGSDDIPQTPLLKLFAEHAPRAVSQLQENSHLTIRTKKLGENQEHIVYRLERAGGDAALVDACEIELNADKKIDAVRLTYWGKNGKKTTWTLSDVVLGGTLPEELLAVQLPRGVEVRTSKELSPMDLMGQMFSFLGVFLEAFQGGEETK